MKRDLVQNILIQNLEEYLDSEVMNSSKNCQNDNAMFLTIETLQGMVIQVVVTEPKKEVIELKENKVIEPKRSNPQSANLSPVTPDVEELIYEAHLNGDGYGTIINKLRDKYALKDKQHVVNIIRRVQKRKIKSVGKEPDKELCVIKAYYIWKTENLDLTKLSLNGYRKLVVKDCNFSKEQLDVARRVFNRFELKKGFCSYLASTLALHLMERGADLNKVDKFLRRNVKVDQADEYQTLLGSNWDEETLKEYQLL